MRLYRYRYLQIVIISLFFFLVTSCVSQKEIVYFQTDQEMDGQADILNSHTAKIQPGDILSVMVSSLSAEASAMFNPYQLMNQGIQRETPQANAPAAAHGYLVDQDGMISLPLIGQLKLGGLTTAEANTLITQKLDKYLQQPTVNLRILNFKVSVLGEVARPSVYTIPNEKITLPEAISLAGDLTIYGKRNNVMLIREVNGKREFARIDLTKRDLFNSPYYYLHTNDVIYVEPTKGKVTSSDRTIQLAPIVLSGLSLMTLILTQLLK